MGAQLSTRTKSSKPLPKVAKKLAPKASNGKAGKVSARPAVAPQSPLKPKSIKSSVISKSVPVKTAAKPKNPLVKTTKTVVAKAKPKPSSKAPIVARPKTKSPEKIVKTVAPAKKITPPTPVPKVKPPRKVAKPISRQIITNQALSAFEKALKFFNSRDFLQAKQKFEDIHLRFHSEVEIIARSQTYIQICEARLASQNSAPRSADECYDRGIVALNVGDFLQARTLFEKALKLRPNDTHTLYSLAAALAQTDAIEQSLKYLGQAVQKHPRLRQRALNDTDFSILKEDRRFLELLGASSPFDLLEARRELS
jgi:hypothetical protein